MSYQLKLDEDSNEYLLDGKDLTKSQLIERLLKMNIELDNKVESKQYFVDLYNKLIQHYDYRMKIKSILDADTAGIDKIKLSRKRERDTGSGINSSTALPREDAETRYNFNLENSVNPHREEKEKNFQEDLKAHDIYQINNSNKNLDLPGFMMKIHADLNSYKNRVKNFEGALIEIKKSQSDKEQPKVYYSDNLYFHQSDSRVTSKKPSQKNSRTNLRSVNASSKNIPRNSNDNKVEISSNNRLNINLNENHREEEKLPADFSASDNEMNPDFCIKQPHNRRRNGIIFESTANFPRIESKNSRKSLPGSSKNIQEILNKIDTKSNPPISPKLSNVSNKSFVFKSFRGENYIPIQASHKGNSNSRLNSSRQLIISVRENPSNVSEFFTQRVTDGITRKFSTFSNSIHQFDAKIFNFKSVNYIVFYSIVMAGVILLAYFVLNHTDFSHMEDKHRILMVLINFGLILLYVTKKILTRNFFKKAANEDYNMIKDILLNMYSVEENPIGLFESNILKDFSLKHNMSEANYKKFVFPLIKKLKDDEDSIVENEIIIQEQSQNVWKLK